MKNKGFTLIELLAVIVILAVIAVIAVPTILKVVEKSKKGAAESSAYGYIDAVEKALVLNQVKGLEEIKDGEYELPLDSKYNVNVKGSKPSSGNLTITKGRVVSASMCISNYTVEYSNTKATAIKKCNEETLDASQIQYKDGKTIAQALDELRG